MAWNKFKQEYFYRNGKEKNDEDDGLIGKVATTALAAT